VLCDATRRNGTVDFCPGDAQCASCGVTAPFASGACAAIPGNGAASVKIECLTGRPPLVEPNAEECELVAFELPDCLRGDAPNDRTSVISPAGSCQPGPEGTSFRTSKLGDAGGARAEFFAAAACAGAPTSTRDFTPGQCRNDAGFGAQSLTARCGTPSPPPPSPSARPSASASAAPSASASAVPSASPTPSATYVVPQKPA
jgi:hypothetical protein